VAVKKLKIAPQPLHIPEGFEILPLGVLLYQKPTGTLLANTYFENEFGSAEASRFATTPPLHLIQERPLNLEVFSMPGRHEGYVIQNARNEKAAIEIKVSILGKPEDQTFLILVEDVTAKAALQKEAIQNHIALEKTLSDLKQTQKALIQSEKLSSLGRFASGLAHELNQPLTSIKGNNEEMIQFEPLTEKSKEYAEEIKTATNHMAKIIKNFRTFARESNEELMETCVENVLEDSIGITKYSLLQKGINMETHISSPLPLVKANPTEFMQVIINLISNARDAIEQSGNQDGKIEIQAERKNEIVEIKIRDNGCGMDSNTRQKIFEPFFTTKEVGKGTGLGMSISFGILKKMNAQISIQSEVGQGTEFTIIIPVLKTETKGEQHEHQ